MRLEYKRVRISTVAGMKRAERLQSNGWIVISSDFNWILMERVKR